MTSLVKSMNIMKWLVFMIAINSLILIINNVLIMVMMGWLS
jgi:hypothetical protein